MGKGSECSISDVVFFLIKKGAHLNPIKATTSEIAEGIGVSQQTASRKLIALEKEGAIKRGREGISITPQTLAEVRKFMADMLLALESDKLTFVGKVSSGIGKGAYFVSQEEYMRSFKKILEFAPFAGTLNVKIEGDDIEKRILLRQRKPLVVEGFKRGKNEFGKIDCYRCVINGLPGAVIFPEMSIHGLQVMEIISPFNLREKLSLSDGSTVNVEIV